MMLLMQAELPSLYQHLTFVDEKCKKEGIIVICTDIGRADGRDIEDINAIDSSLLSGSNTSLAFDFENYEYYIPIDGKILDNVFGYYHVGDTVSIDIVFFLQKGRIRKEYLSYISNISPLSEGLRR